ncbi:MAG: N-acetylmuramoyl-L-alanine amidase [Clostridia bacterium]|nr:N-acetylmuramoyl-L-alanine amidase [Clostridia bacterium]
MKQIKRRRRRLRINNPVGFSLFCILCLALLAGLIVGVYYLIEYGPGACAAFSQYLEERDATPAPTATPTPTLPPTSTPSSDNANTPIVGEQETPTPDTSADSTAVPSDYTPSTATPDPNAPLYGFTIGLDPFRDSASRFDEEAVYNLEFAFKFKEYLEQRGATVVLTREDNDRSYSDTARINAINDANCDIALRFLCNHLDSRGTVGCYAQSLSRNEETARTIVNAYIATTGLSTRKSDGFEADSNAFLRNTDCVAVTLIIGHWTNSGEREKLLDSAFQELMMEGLYNGLLSCLKPA